MVGHFRTKEHCPVCGGEYALLPDGFECKTHRTRPRYCYLDLSWKGKQHKIYNDRQGNRLDSWEEASKLYIAINHAIGEKRFDPSQYIRGESRKFWITTLLGEYEERKLKNVAPSWRNDCKRYGTDACRFFKEKDVREIQPLDLDDFRDHLGEERKLGVKSVKNTLDYLKTFLGWCLERKRVIPFVPAFPQLAEYAPQPRYIKPEAMAALYDFTPEYGKPIIGFLMCHGCRPGEARAVKMKDIDLKLKIITIRRTWSRKELREVRKGPFGKAEPYTIPIHPDSWEYIQARAGEALPEAFLFVNLSGKPFSEDHLRHLWDKVRKAAGISKDLRLYDCTRHSFATNRSLAGTDIKKLRDLMGHADIRTTMKYTHRNVEYLRGDLEMFSVRKPAEVVAIEAKGRHK